MDFYEFYIGHSFDAYKWLGAHIEKDGVTFRTFAPNAVGVSLLFRQKEYPMKKVYDKNFYEITLQNAKVGETYEYRIFKADGSYTDHCDPFGYGMELRPLHKSIIRDLDEFQFSDDLWMKKRTDCLDKPLNIYEVHLGFWKKKGEAADSWYHYDELAALLIPYLKESGYNYVELMPISEHPCDESWGYQNTGFYSPTSRYGTATDLKKMINLFHNNGIGVILDFVPVHFAVDDYALAKYDGTSLFEYPHTDVGVSEWGSYNFMHSRGEVSSFLQSCANYWLREYHFDGLRMDAISRIIYWQGDEKRGVNGKAVDFIKTMNKGLKKRNAGCILIAEDSTNYPKVTTRLDTEGLGFDYKWDMGWMNDTLDFFKSNPEDRIKNYHKLTFSMMYFSNENYLLPFSHDEVVHGKGTILGKMYGRYKEKFSQARALYLYMMLHPGKKLNFMGNEIAQIREWDEKKEQDWSLIKYPTHDSFYKYISELNSVYLSNSALYEQDYNEQGFRWIDCHQEQNCIYAFERCSKTERVICVLNLGDKCQSSYSIKLKKADKLTLILNTDWERFSGNTRETEKVFEYKEQELISSLKPYSGLLFKVE